MPLPQFEQKQVGGAVVRVTLRIDHNLREKWIDADVSGVIGDEQAASLTDFEKRIVNFTAEHGRINITDAMKLMPKPRWHTAQNRLMKLEKAGILAHVSRYLRDSSAYYVLIIPESDIKYKHDGYGPDGSWGHSKYGDESPPPGA